jgi:hypothetical protein
MTRAALEHTYSILESPEDDPAAPVEEWRDTQYGVMRIVRNRRRVRLLKRRGVEMWKIAGTWCWFVDHPRLMEERRKRLEGLESA